MCDCEICEKHGRLVLDQAYSPRVAVTSRLVGRSLCNACRQQKDATTHFDVRENGSAAVALCDDCLRALLPPALVR